MQIKFSAEPTGDAVAYLAFEGEKGIEFGGGLEPAGEAAFRRAASAGTFKGGAGQILEILAAEWIDAPRALLVGVGRKSALTDLGWQKAAGGLVKRLITSGTKSLSIVGAPDRGVAAQLAFGARLASYRFDQYRPNLKPEKKPTLGTVSIVTDSAAGARSDYAPLSARAEGVELARNLVSEPPNILTPKTFADRISSLESLGLEIIVLDVATMAKLGMEALLGVGQGSANEPRLCLIRWSGAKNKKARPLALIGKGVTFDTGGISLKPGLGMQDMKGDMAGAAAVVGAMVAIAKAKLPLNVVGGVGLVENMPSGTAQRPGDIIRSAAGITIEMTHTDAEGRMVLADVMHHVTTQYNPHTMVDLATLTGAIVTSLGNAYAGLFSNDDSLAASIISNGKKNGESYWRMPYGAEYEQFLESEFADLKNWIGGVVPSSIIAATFLSKFVKEGVVWAHLDIAGVAWRGAAQSNSPSWATGFGVRTLVDFANQLAAQQGD